MNVHVNQNPNLLAELQKTYLLLYHAHLKSSANKLKITFKILFIPQGSYSTSKVCLTVILPNCFALLLNRAHT